MGLGNLFRSLRGSSEMETKKDEVFPVQKSDADLTALLARHGITINQPGTAPATPPAGAPTLAPAPAPAPTRR